MKKYIQITAGRGPVECAKVVTLVAKESLRCNLQTANLTIKLMGALCQ